MLGPGEILADLRAIHLPPESGTIALGWALWPWLLIGGLILACGALRWMRRRHWRGQTRRRLQMVSDDPAVTRQWAMVAALLPRLAARLPSHRRTRLRPPKALSQPPATIGRREVADLRGFARRLLQ